MLVTNITGKLNEEKFKEFIVEYIDIDWYDAHKKIQKYTLKSGMDIGLRLEQEIVVRGLLQDDVLGLIDNTVIAINIKECDCIAVEFENNLKIAKVCYEIGNRHAQLFFSDDNFLIMPYDKPTFEFLKNLHANPILKKLKIHANMSISNYGNLSHAHHHDENEHHGHTHSHEHSHKH